MSSLIGRGPVAEVYAVEGRALKVFPGRFDRRTLATIERERVKLAATTAPVLPFEGVELVGGSRHALTMELCADSLRERVRRDGPLPSEEVAALCRSLAGALTAAHALGVLHGGVSPANVLFRANGEPVLADFGVAQRQEFRRDPLSVIEWRPPETLRTGEVEPPTDVYGLGAVLHFALTGQSPHPSRIGETTGERILRVLGEPPPAVSRPDVPVALSTAIGRMLAHDPARRSMPPVEQPPPPARPAHPDRRRWYVALVGLLALVVVAVALRPGDRPQQTPANPVATEAPTPIVELKEPTDRQDEVALSWTTNDDSLFFAVVFWVEGERRQTVLARYGREKTVSVDPDPTRRYCFLVRGTKGGEIYESESRAVRGAVCHR